LKTDYVDLLTLSWWNSPPPARILDAALELKARGKVLHLMISSHNRPSFAQAIDNTAYDALMVRYNAAHPGAEQEVFPHLARRRPGVVAFTATRWGSLLNPAFTPPGEMTPTTSDCYRFALSNPNVDVTLAGPKDQTQLDQALVTLEKGPMSEDELQWMRRVGAHVRSSTGRTPMAVADRLAQLFACKPQPPAALPRST
jgi:aryl-alcohol dehydrogenase-like predicted oxidoreductase